MGRKIGMSALAFITFKLSDILKGEGVAKKGLS